MRRCVKKNSARCSTRWVRPDPLFQIAEWLAASFGAFRVNCWPQVPAPAYVIHMVPFVGVISPSDTQNSCF